jgi:hypothetical protein
MARGGLLALLALSLALAVVAGELTEQEVREAHWLAD